MRPPLVLFVVKSGPGQWTAMCSQHGALGWINHEGMTSWLLLGHAAHHHQPATTPQETP